MFSSPEYVWATLADGRDVIIERPAVIRDTVFGLVDGMPLVVPAEQVTEVRVRRINKVRTAIIPASLIVGVTGVIVFVKTTGKDSPPDSSDSYNCRSQSDPMNCN